MKFRRDKELDGFQWIYSFENGFSVSIVFHKYSYGSEKGYFEAALIRDEKLCQSLKSETLFRGDQIEGHLDFGGVYTLLEEVKSWSPDHPVFFLQ